MRTLLIFCIMVALVGVILLMIAEFTLTSQGHWQALISHIGAIALGVAVVETAFHFISARSLVHDVSSRVMLAIRFPIEGFYQTRKEFDLISDIAKEQQRSVIGIYYTGKTFHSRPDDVLDRFDSIVLPRPKSTAISELAKVVSDNADQLNHDIVRSQQIFKKVGCQVLLFDGPIFYSMTWAKTSEWIHVELLIPSRDIAPDHRPSFRISNKRSPDVYRRLSQAAEEIIDRSQS